MTAPDALTHLAYQNDFNNGLYSAPVTVIGSGTATAPITGALVDFKAATSRVSAILPYAANHSAGEGDAPGPAVRMENGVHVLSGRFLGVWDAEGNNRAPGGAREVRVNAASGEVLSIQ